MSIIDSKEKEVESIPCSHQYSKGASETPGCSTFADQALYPLAREEVFVEGDRENERKKKRKKKDTGTVWEGGNSSSNDLPRAERGTGGDVSARHFTTNDVVSCFKKHAGATKYATTSPLQQHRRTL